MNESKTISPPQEKKIVGSTQTKNEQKTEDNYYVKRKCVYECECKKCERCSKCDYTVNGLRSFHWRGDKLFCEFCLQDQQKVVQPKNGEVKFKDDFIDAPNLTEEQRKQLGHGCYIKKAPEFVRSKTRELITLKGITTSQVNQASKAKNPYPARVFLKIEGQEQDIPVFFRKKEGEKWIRPKIKTGSWIEVKGHFSLGTVYTKQSERKSFTAYSYQVLSSNQAKVETYAR